MGGDNIGTFCSNKIKVCYIVINPERDIYDGLLSSKIFLDRIQENGIVKNENSTGHL